MKGGETSRRLLLFTNFRALKESFLKSNELFEEMQSGNCKRIFLFLLFLFLRNFEDKTKFFTLRSRMNFNFNTVPYVQLMFGGISI